MKRIVLTLAAMTFSVSVAMADNALDSHGGVLEEYISFNFSYSAPDTHKENHRNASPNESSNSIDNEITAGDSKNSLLDTNPDSNF